MTAAELIADPFHHSIGDAVLVSGACLFASWTVFCNIMVLTGSSFADLLTWSFVPVVAGIVLAALCLREPRSAATSGTESWQQQTPAAVGQDARLLPTLTIATITTLAAILRLAEAPFGLVWAALVGTAVLAVKGLSMAGAPPSSQPSLTPEWQSRGAGALIVVGALLAAITHRPDPDDALLLNLIVTALDSPFESLMSHSGMWLDRTAPLILPIYRFHSYELLVAALSHAFEVDHKIFYYMVLPPLSGAAAVLVHWRLARYLVPRHALSVLATWLVLVIALGESHRAFGNFAFVRMFQGKGVLVTVALPLCLLLALRFGEAPEWRRAVALGAAVIASLGLSSSALATAPVIVAVVLAASLWGTSGATAIRITIGAIAAVIYLVAVGVALYGTTPVGSPGIYRSSSPGATGGLDRVLGNGIPGAIVLALFPLAPLLVAAPRRRRIYAGTTLIFVIAVLNPWTVTGVSKLLTSNLQWRLFWSVPFVVSASIAVVGLAVLIANRVPSAARVTVLPILLVATLLVSNRWSISPKNQVAIALPRYKVMPSPHAAAKEIVRLAPPNSTVYAPASVAVWITTFRQHPYPLVVRPLYIRSMTLRRHFGNREVKRRTRVLRFLEGREDDPAAADFFAIQVEHERPALVVFESQVSTAGALRALLREAGYVGTQRNPYEMWRRPAPE